MVHENQLCGPGQIRIILDFMIRILINDADPDREPGNKNKP